VRRLADFLSDEDCDCDEYCERYERDEDQIGRFAGLTLYFIL
jgi:hypothetical protein